MSLLKVTDAKAETVVRMLAFLRKRGFEPYVDSDGGQYYIVFGS